MGLFAPPKPKPQHGDFITKCKYRCTNENCRAVGWFSRAIRHLCPKCFAHTEIIDSKRYVYRAK